MFQRNRLLGAFMEMRMFSNLKSVGAYIFQGSSLSKTELPDSITVLGNDAFRECSLTSIILKEGLLTMSRSFYSCGRLQNITIPSTVTALGSEPFYRCSALMYIKVLPATPPTISGNWLGYSNLAQVYVPDSSLAAYKAASGWSTYASRIHSMSEFAD